MHAAVIGDYPSPADPNAEFVGPAGFVLFFRIQKDIWDPSTVPGAIRRAAEQRFDRTIEAPLAAIDLPAWVELRFAWGTPEQAVVGTLEDAFAVREIALLSLGASSGAEIEGDGAYRPLCSRPASPEVTAWFPPSPPGLSLSCAAPGPPWRSRGAALEPARAYALLEPVPRGGRPRGCPPPPRHRGVVGQEGEGARPAAPQKDPRVPVLDMAPRLPSPQGTHRRAGRPPLRSQAHAVRRVPLPGGVPGLHGPARRNAPGRGLGDAPDAPGPLVRAVRRRPRGVSGRDGHEHPLHTKALRVLRILGRQPR